MIKIVRDLNLPFYLTGGTALSRIYLHHRYSDDLDLFVNEDQKFKEYINTFLNYFKSPDTPKAFSLNIERLTITDNFVQTFVQNNNIELKIDFVNDLPIRFGKILEDKKLGMVDSMRNILSNKLSALFRFELKDFVDVWAIAKNYDFNWRRIINEAKQKESSVDPLEILNLFKSFPFENLDSIKWIHVVDYNLIKSDFFLIADDILKGGNNSLKLN